MSKVCVMLVLRERKVNTTKDRVNIMGFNVFDEGIKTMRVSNIEYMSMESIQGEMQGGVVSTCKLEVLGP